MKYLSGNKTGIYIIGSLLLQLSALLMMAFDPTPHGFGVLTLVIGAIVLTIGISLPIVAFLKQRSVQEWRDYITHRSFEVGGFFLAFLISFVTYILTLEPTASLWDCSELIAAAYKLQVPHTPGNPLLLLIGRLFSMMAFGDVTKVAWYINLMSAFFSAGAVGFTFLITQYFGKSIFPNNWLIAIASFGGAMILMFSDTFWFSAVEAETYGPSIFFMLLLILLSIEGSKLDEANRKKRILLLSYLTGLSYCIHPMCILVLPVCFLIWQKKENVFRWKSTAISFGSGVLVILIISKVIAVDLFEWIFNLDLFLVNNLSLPFYSGLVFLLFLMSGVIWVMWKKLVRFRVIILSLMLVLAGFSPYIMLFVRSAKHPPINEFSPKNLAKIKSYMNRESYPSRPLLYGPYFDAQITEVSAKATAYIVDEDRYKEVGEVSRYHYEEDRMTILPRIYSNENHHINTYKKWTGLAQGEEPRFSDNLSFMLNYQLGHMYGRYVMWNFAGRSGDIQHADWKKPWDGLASRSSNLYNRANNQYFMIPFLLGIIGLLFQWRKDKKGFVTNLSFFLITGVLLAVYLNGIPNEPRERDYIYVGSYVAFSIWIGLGMMSLFSIVKSKGLIIPVVFAIISVPTWMFYQNLDDHNRSDRTFQIDHARNVLGSLEQGAVLFTGGDNDTFPLWYLQEVEGYRTDVRVMVMSYFNADWYINYLNSKYYDSPPFELTLRYNENQYGPYEPLYIREVMDSPISWGRYMEELKKGNPQIKIKNGSGKDFHFLPSRQISLATNKGVVEFDIKGSYLSKSEMAILDLLYSNGWDRPIYFNYTSLNSLNINIEPYLSKEGLLFRWTPERHEINDGIRINLEKSYEYLVEKADYSNLENQNVYFNQEDYESRMIAPIKFALNELIRKYLEKGDNAKAIDLVDFAQDKLYFDHLSPSYADIQLGQLLAILDREEASEKMINRVFLYYYGRVKDQINDESVSRNDLVVLQECVRLLRDTSLLRKYQNLMEML